MQDYRDFMAEQKTLDTSKLETAARWWDLLAEADHNPYCAETYRRTAESLRIEEGIGVAVCVCCFKPYGSHRR